MLPPYLRDVKTRARLAAIAGTLVKPQDTVPYEKRVQQTYWECLSQRGRERVRARLTEDARKQLDRAAAKRRAARERKARMRAERSHTTAPQ